MNSGTMDTRDSNISTSDCHFSSPGSTQELGQAWQLGGTSVPLSTDGTDFIPSSTPLRNQDWMEPAQPRSSAYHWVLPAAWAPEVAAADATAVDSAGGWTISTASVVHHTHYSAEYALMAMSDEAAANLDCSSDPLTCTAQLMLAAAAPRIHCVPDSASLLNSGAVLLLGQGSTTMCGTNTAQELGSAASGHILNPEDPQSHVRSTPQHSVQDLHQQQVPMPAQQQQQAGPTAAAGRAAPRRTRSRRRLGLLVDSALGLQQLVAAAAGGHQHEPDTRQHRLSPAHDCSSCHEQQQQQHSHSHAHQGTARGAVGSGQRPQTGPRAPIRQEACTSGPSTSAVNSTSTPASADVLVLCGSNTGVRGPPAALTAPPAGSAQVPAGAAGPQQQHTPAQAPRAAADAGTAEPNAAAAAILQLLSCSSLSSYPVAGRSNSSLLHQNLSNCSILRLGSLTLQNSSFSSSQDSSAAQSRAASFCGQQQHTSNGHAAAAAAAASTAVGWSVHSPAGGVMPLGPTSRPSPLPMLHESRSWGQNLDAADRVMDVQRRHSMHARPDANSQAQQQQAHKQHAQLIYLLD